MCSSCNDARNDGYCAGAGKARRQGCCLDRPYDCTGKRPRGPSGRGKCRCELEESWNKCTPPRPHRDWPGNFGELRRRWSEHVKRQSCSCDDCRKKSVLPLAYNDTVETSPNTDYEDESDDCQRRDLRHTSNYKCPASSRFSSSRHSSASAKNTSGRCDADNGCCLCQAARRDCCCPVPVQVDARSHENCSCECLEPAECPCSPAERRFPRPGRRCAVADSCPVNRVKDECKRCRTSSDSEDRCKLNSRQEKYEQHQNVQKCRNNTYEPKHPNSNRSSCCATKAISNCLNPPSARQISKNIQVSSASAGGDGVSFGGVSRIISFALLILVGVAWAVAAIIRTSTRSRCRRKICRYEFSNLYNEFLS